MQFGCFWEGDLFDYYHFEYLTEISRRAHEVPLINKGIVLCEQTVSSISSLNAFLILQFYCFVINMWEVERMWGLGGAQQGMPKRVATLQCGQHLQNQSSGLPQSLSLPCSYIMNLFSCATFLDLADLGQSVSRKFWLEWAPRSSLSPLPFHLYS